jgi:hypothetical protein
MHDCNTSTCFVELYHLSTLAYLNQVYTKIKYKTDIQHIYMVILSRILSIVIDIYSIKCLKIFQKNTSNHFKQKFQHFSL